MLDVNMNKKGFKFMEESIGGKLVVEDGASK